MIFFGNKVNVFPATGWVTHLQDDQIKEPEKQSSTNNDMKNAAPYHPTSPRESNLDVMTGIAVAITV